jgi:hypothetical protein
MPNIYDDIYKKYNLKKTCTYIETGCYKGRGIIKPACGKCPGITCRCNPINTKTIGILNNYEKIYSIELVKKYYELNKKQFQNYKHVTIIHGNSPEKLSELLLNINYPVTVFLDAHWSGGDTGRLNKDSPLLEELYVLKKRKYNDIIIIDDTRCIGKTGNSGRAGNANYPPMKYDWTDISIEDIKKNIKENYIILENKHKNITDGKADQMILLPQII